MKTTVEKFTDSLSIGNEKQQALATILKSTLDADEEIETVATDNSVTITFDDEEDASYAASLIDTFSIFETCKGIAKKIWESAQSDGNSIRFAINKNNTTRLPEMKEPYVMFADSDNINGKEIIDPFNPTRLYHAIKPESEARNIAYRKYAHYYKKILRNNGEYYYEYVVTEYLG